MKHICILSGLEIPKGQESKEHFCPRSILPPALSNHPWNVYLAIKIINNIKSNRFPCEWEEQKRGLYRYALVHYKLRHGDRQIIQQALNNPYRLDNPCTYCICSIHQEYCCKNR